MLDSTYVRKMKNLRFKQLFDYGYRELIFSELAYSTAHLLIFMEDKYPELKDDKLYQAYRAHWEYVLDEIELKLEEEEYV